MWKTLTFPLREPGKQQPPCEFMFNLFCVVITDRLVTQHQAGREDLHGNRTSNSPVAKINSSITYIAQKTMSTTVLLTTAQMISALPRHPAVPITQNNRLSASVYAGPLKPG